MTLFFTLLGKITPLYFSIVLGFFSTKFLDCNKETVAKILLYILAPLIIFNATLSVHINSSVIFLPIFFFILSLIIAFGTLPIFYQIFKDNSANVLSFSVATGNTGNLGIPIAILFLEPKLVDVYIFTVLASMLYQNSVGYYITAKSAFTTKESLKKVMKLPVIHAFILGLIFNILGFKMPEVFIPYTIYLKGTYAILGMMLLGMGLEHMKTNGGFDKLFVSLALFVKFILWPLLVLAFICADKNYFHFLDQDLYLVMFIFSIVPLAANTVTVATLLNVKPEKMAVAVLISTLISLFYIPLMIFLYNN
ncbi:MAG: AEC family transporter [Candidatus Marinarcus sp.]|uniref:AEC family transporter n=1 Tax=Candidatus Marinarcus sp. TaxID=3100987 RepID=UPI003B00F7EE